MAEALEARGVIVPILTPLTNGGERIDENALAAHASWLIEQGVFGLMPCGTTGEGPLLRTEERKRVLERVMDVVRGQVAVLAHVGGITTNETIELAQHAQHMGVDAISVVTPYFYGLPDSVLAQYYRDVAASVAELPVYLYNIPQNTGNSLSRAIVAEILEHSANVVGIKDSSGDLANLSNYLDQRDGQFQVICGSDALTLQALQQGAVATVSGNANVFPEVVVKLTAAYEAKDYALAEKLQRKLDVIRNSLDNGGNLSLMKRILECRGFRCGNVRPPLGEVSMAKVTEVREQLVFHDLLQRG